MTHGRQTVSTPEQALAYVEEHGIVLESGRGGPSPSLAEVIAGEPIRGSWWAHPKARLIFRATRYVRDSPDILLCSLVQRKLVYVHRRLWPALVRLADELEPKRIDSIREEHTSSGAHKLVTIPFPEWVPHDVAAKAKKLSKEGARNLISEWL